MSTPSVSTADGAPDPDPSAVTPTDPEPAAASRPRRRRWLWGAVIAVVAAVVVGVVFIPTPYYLFQPGSVRPAETRIDVSGAPSYETDGDVLFTTVYVDQASLAMLARGWLDDAVEIRSEEEVYGPEGKDASRKENQQRMDLSKLIATKAALDYLDQPAEFTGHGAKVLGVTEDGPSVGELRAGDVITSVAGKEISLPSDIQRALEGEQAGDVVEVVARRVSDGKERTVDVSITLGSAPIDDEPGESTTTTRPPGSDASTGQSDGASGAAPGRTRPILGVSVEPDDPSVSSPVQVEIDSGDVTGPSAGLAWALAVVDRLTPESLTDGRDVAVTGEILPDGSVGPIGGIVQKVAAVKRAGVRTFLYPASTGAAEQRQMRRVADGDVRLVPVATLSEAVDALHPGGVRMGT